MKIVIVIPAFNESRVIFEVLKALPRRLKGVSSVDIVVIDDGSLDTTFKEAKKAGVNIVRHSLNRGLGAAIKTGFSWAREQNADIVVTFDADGQHDPADIPKLINPIIFKKADLVIGSRFRSKQRIPTDRLFINWFANFATFILYGVYCSDSQSGMRAFSQKAINLIDFKADRMEFSSEILLEAKRNKLKVAEIPIKAVYTNYSRLKGQKNLNAIPVFARFLIRLLR